MRIRSLGREARHSDSGGSECCGSVVIKLVMTAAGSQRVRFAISPLEEVLGAVQTLLGVRGHPAHLPWVSSAPALADLGISELATVLNARHYITEFLSPPPDGPETTAETQLNAVRATPPSQVALELAMVDADLSALPDDPAAARDLLADQLETVWNALLAPAWPALRELLAADIAHRTRLLGEGGLTKALAELHPGVRLAGTSILVDLRSRERLDIDARGLLLIPAVFAWPNVGVVTVPPWQPALLYPARGVASLWATPTEPLEALTNLLGRTRALLLARLDRPSATVDLAQQLRLAPATVSAHLTTLGAAGLLTNDRSRHRVLYRRTALGDALLQANAAPKDTLPTWSTKG
ncbi:transcriptional regulator [Amycolatopsis sp. A1MSW2902]